MGLKTTTNGEVRRAKEIISIAVCKANYVYMEVMRTGRLRNGLNKVQAVARAADRKRTREANQVLAQVVGNTVDAQDQAVDLTVGSQIQAQVVCDTEDDGEAHGWDF